MQSIVNHLPLLLLAGGTLVLLATGRPLIGNGTLAERQTRYRSLQVASPILNWLISVSVIGAPILQYILDRDWSTDLVPILLPVVLVLTASVFAMLGGFIFFLFRAIRNINAFAGTRIRSPYAALFTVVPIANLIVIPYLEYFAYHRSWRAAAPETASKYRAALLALSAFTLLVVSVAISRLGEQAAQTIYDPLSLLILALCTGGAGGILTARVLSRIAAAQELCAQRRGLIAGTPVEPGNEHRARRREMLSSAGVGLLVTAAVIVALFPALPSQILRNHLLPLLP